jgi:hypothetical protein
MLPLVIIVALLLLAKTVQQYYLVSNMIKIFMLLGISSMWYFKSGIGPYIFMQFANFLEKLF